MSLTPHEVVSLYLKYNRRAKECGTSLQKDELNGQLGRELQHVQWEVEVSDITANEIGFELRGTVGVPELRKWGSGGKWPLVARLTDKDLRERLLNLKPGQRVRVEGRAVCDSITEG